MVLGLSALAAAQNDVDLENKGVPLATFNREEIRE